MPNKVKTIKIKIKKIKIQMNDEIRSQFQCLFNEWLFYVETH